MSTRNPDYHEDRSLPEIVSAALWRSRRFDLGVQAVEELRSEYGVTVGYEAMRLWGLPCVRCFAKRLRHSRLSYTADGRYDPGAQDTRRHA
jgi:hypothetical protein